MCPWWLLEQPVGQTLEWPVSWDSIACDSFISVDLHACETVLKYFPGFCQVQPQYSSKPIQILINIPRPEQWWLKFIVVFHTITLEIMHSHPRYHIYAIFSSVMITDWPCVAKYQMYFVWSSRRCLDPRWLRAAQSHFGTAPAPASHVCQVNNLVFWIDDATATRGQLGSRIRFGYGQCGGESGTEFE